MNQKINTMGKLNMKNTECNYLVSSKQIVRLYLSHYSKNRLAIYYPY